MARFAIIDAGRVTNIVEADAAFAASIGAIDATGGKVGDLWDGTQYTTPPPPPAPVPAEITMRQARLSLLGAGKLAAVDTAINAMVEPAKSAAKIEWEYSNTVQRHNGFVAALGPALGLTDAQIDALFLAAQAL
jgi:hypothetical protein